MNLGQIKDMIAHRESLLRRLRVLTADRTVSFDVCCILLQAIKKAESEISDLKGKRDA